MKVKECTYNEIFDNKNFDKIAQDYALVGEIRSLASGNANKEYYKKLYDNKQLNFIGIFDDDNCLVGGCSLLYMNYPHSNKNVLMIESLFIQNEYRDIYAPILFKKIFKFAKDCGCSGVLIGAPYHSDFAVSCEKYFKPLSKVFYYEISKN